MNARDRKIYSLRHFLFYMGVGCIASTLVWAAPKLLAWSHNLSVAVLFVAGVVVCLRALRESLFAPAQKPEQQRGRHV